MKRISALAAGILGISAVFLLARPASASSLAYTTVICTSNGGGPIGPATKSQSCNGTAGETATGSLGDAAASAAGTTPNGTYDEDEVNHLFGAAGTATYFFDVFAPVGADPNLKVALDISAALSAGTTGQEDDFLDQDFAEAVLRIKSDPLVYFATSACAGFGCRRAEHGGREPDRVGIPQS